MLLSTLIDWSRWQFAMSAMYHWIFVPLTLGMGIIMAIAETKYYRNGGEFWKQTAKFWQKVFGINFAAGIATGLILEFQFGTNWSNYSYFVGDIFGAPLAIEGLFAFFMEATFFAVMFFGWDKVSKKFHLTATWLTIGGATLSAWWILVANAFMQNPAGMIFNPDTVRHEMVSFTDVALNPVAVSKFFHSVISSWLLGSVVVMGICSYYLLRNRNTKFAIESLRIGATLGLVASILTFVSGHMSAGEVAEHQPMKLAAMENLYQGSKEAPLTILGLVSKEAKRGEQTTNDEGYTGGVSLSMPYALSVLSFNDPQAFVPGMKDIIDGYTTHDGKVVLPVAERMERGRIAIQALADYRTAKEAGNLEEAERQKAILDENFEHFGYGYINSVDELIPNVPMLYYSFRLMVYLGGLFLIVCIILLIFLNKNSEKLTRMRWFQWVMIICIPLVYIASQAGWVVAEVGRQPWTVQDALPVQAAISNIAAGAVKTTFFLFLGLFTLMLIAELSIMINAIKKGPKLEKKGETNTEN